MTTTSPGAEDPTRSRRQERRWIQPAPDMKFLPNTNDWYGRHRLVARRENDYFIDPRHAENVNYRFISCQDQAAWSAWARSSIVR